ncbi:MULTISPECIES: invasion associated locus B family protein [unclassified Xanthobacter]|uniref:invasion associated locus B family protein n=1 Tax=unclassified Xanthobacter TaxID=2623496 RepID=UPI001EDEDA1E|nr:MULTISPECIES: invasion associated locus B family protein [unclassified Xanthobacter]
MKTMSQQASQPQGAQMGKRIAAIAALAGALLAGAPARAETPTATPAPTETSSTHDDWTVRCKPEAKGRSCEAVQTLQTEDLKNILAHMAVRAIKDGPVYLIVQVPPGVWLPANVTFKVGGVPDLVLTYKRCGQSCIASLKLEPAQVAALKASAGKGELLFENGSRNPVILPISFKGLGEAMAAALNK